MPDAPIWGHSDHSLNPRRSRVIPGDEPAVKVRRSRTTAWHQPILRRFGVIHVAGAPISGFTRGDLKPIGISGRAPRSYIDLGRPFRERAGERRFGVAPKGRPKPRRFGVIHAGIRRSGVSRRFGVIHQNLRRSGQNPNILLLDLSYRFWLHAGRIQARQGCRLGPACVEPAFFLGGLVVRGFFFFCGLLERSPG